jgi:Cu(I)/Ag(I) efflux system membrane protein CusA/SilA
MGFKFSVFLGVGVLVYGSYLIFGSLIPVGIKDLFVRHANIVVIGLMGLLLTHYWMPLRLGKGFILNLVFVGGLLFGVMSLFSLFLKNYARILMFCLNHKRLFISVPLGIVFFGLMIWLGFAKVILPVTGILRPLGIKEVAVLRVWPLSALNHAFPGLGKEFMPPLDEGSFLYMPTTMPHASIGEALDVLQNRTS